jgi:mutual gliding-motility protein MglA
MPNVFHAKKEILLKIVYYGPGLGGKTTNLEALHANSRPDKRGKLLSLATETERTIFFDLLPVELGTFRGYTIRLHLCTVPGQIALEQTRRLVLRNVDGVVFVVDSQPETLDANRESLADLAYNLRLIGLEPDRVPVVVQYNKQDLVYAWPPEKLERELGIPPDVPSVPASAKWSHGVFETLRTIVRECVQLLGNPALAPDGRTPSILPGRRASMYPGGRASDQIPAVPKPARSPNFEAREVKDDEPPGGPPA